MPRLAMHEAFFFPPVALRDEVDGSGHSLRGGFEMIHGGEVEVLDAVTGGEGEGGG